jgi:hypothetical protein
LWTPTISGRASAAVIIDIPAPMVTASATAILIDIKFPLRFAPSAPAGAVKFTQTLQNTGSPTWF